MSEHETPDAPPPLLKSWRNLYILEVVVLALLIAFFVAITETYR